MTSDRVSLRMSRRLFVGAGVAALATPALLRSAYAQDKFTMKIAHTEGIGTPITNAFDKWVGILNDEAATANMKEIESGIADTYFAWAGPTTRSGT